VLFSNTQIASYLNKNFECTWQTVRSVPTLTLDLGNGKVIIRTLHGNIATYICTSDGSVVDVLPGMYTPDTYIDRLRAVENTFLSLSQSANLADQLGSYHKRELVRIVTSGVFSPSSTVPVPSLQVPKSIERAGLMGLLATDTQINETERRSQIHQQLLASGLIRPASMTHWLYREVLHADLDDPYLGLGQLLTSSYPFEGREQ